MRVIRKYCGACSYEPGSLVLLAGTVYRALRATKPGERPTSSPDAWAVEDMPERRAKTLLGSMLSERQ